MEQLPIEFPPDIGSGDGTAATANNAANDLFGRYSSVSDQACKECRRRKARCNRSLPTCDICIKYRRHCLYEKHSKTPLTRKHLTDVETRLERAEAIIRQLRTQEMASNRHGSNGKSSDRVPTLTEEQSQQERQQASLDDAEASTRRPTTALPIPQPEPFNFPSQSAHQSTQNNMDPDNQRALEEPPLDEFGWNERDSPMSVNAISGYEGRPDAEETPISDGMASLSVAERESGYLGVASGAALLRLISPDSRKRDSRSGPDHPVFITTQVNPNRLITDVMVDAYFQYYHVCYPIVHEPTFRAQYSEVIPRPNGSCWTALAYLIASIGVWITGKGTENLDLSLFSHARAIFGDIFMEVGNLTLVQGLTLASNYQQKRDKPNSGYNYLGLACRIAMGLGLYKEFPGWGISPLDMEIRRRVWWTMCCFDIGATITFSRPNVWPHNGVDVSYPLNVQDKDLTVASKTYPLPSEEATPYMAIANQGHFHEATRRCYERVISTPFPTAEELLKTESEDISDWISQIPPYFAENATVPAKYALPHAIMSWRLRNFRIIMYRSFVIRSAIRRKPDTQKASKQAYNRCLADAKSSIEMIGDYWKHHEHNRLSAWYALYFIFQAALIPCICLRNNPTEEQSADWRQQLMQAINTMKSIAPFNTSSTRCCQTLTDLCGQYLEEQDTVGPLPPGSNIDEPSAAVPPENTYCTQPVGESPETQINNMWNFLWPNTAHQEMPDVLMTEGSGWMEFLQTDSLDALDQTTPEN